MYLCFYAPSSLPEKDKYIDTYRYILNSQLSTLNSQLPLGQLVGPPVAKVDAGHPKEVEPKEVDAAGEPKKVEEDAKVEEVAA